MLSITSKSMAMVQHHRHFASAMAAAVTQTATALPQRLPVEKKVTQLPTGLTVASIDYQGSVAQLAMSFKAGTRYEQPDEAGLVHFLRNIIGSDSSRYLGLKLLWQSGTIGSSIQTSASKDLLTIQLSVLRTNDKVGMSILGELSQPVFKQWEILSRSSTIQEDLKLQTAEDIVMANLYRAAYRNGPLGSPLIAPGRALYNIMGNSAWGNSALIRQAYQQLTAYARSRLVAGQAALVGVNVDHDTLVAYATEQQPLPQGEASTKSVTPSTYFGGDFRVESSSRNLADVAIVGQGAKLTDMKSVAVQTVLTAAYGKGNNGVGVVSRHMRKAAHHNPFSLSPINEVNSDTGLAGVYLKVRGDQAAPLVRAAIDGFEELAKNGPNSGDLESAKREVVLESLQRAEMGANVAQGMAAQLLANQGKGMVLADEFIQLVGQVTEADVKKAAQQVLARLSVSAYGDIHQVPYADVI